MKLRLIELAVMIALSAVCINYSNAQNIPNRITFDTVITNTYGTADVFIKNPTTRILTFYVRTLTPQFEFTSNFISVNPLDSIAFPVLFKTNQNLTYNDFIIFESPDLNYSVVHYLTATAKYPDAVYNFTQGLSDEALKTALKTFCSTNTNNNYTTSRTAMFSTIDDYNMDDSIECIYTGRKVYTTGIPSVNPPQSMNTEHTFPQGFFNQDEPMRSDIHHLYPSDEVANNRRNNYDFGIVVSNITWEVGGSKLGNNSSGSLVFEPRDVHKGNIARCLFYFLIRYQNYGGFMDATQENVLRQWSVTDTVDTKEKIRENAIAAFQNNRSPFVDHPEFIDRIKSTYSVIPAITRPEISASPYTYNYDTLSVNDTAGMYLALFNYGTGNLNISSVTASSPQFTIEKYPAVISQNQYAYAKIKFRPDQINQTFNSTVTIVSNDSIIYVSLKGFSNSTVGVSTYTSEIPVKYSLYQNYPNPFNPETKIRFDIPSSVNGLYSGFSLNVYNTSGKLVYYLNNKNISQGSYEINFDASEYPSGVYYYTLSSGDFTQTKKMILMK